MKIMFVCHGNICRSTMGEFILKDLLQKNGLEGHTVASSAVSCEGKTAVQLTRSDYDRYDLFLVMDQSNLLHICRIFPEDPGHKIHRLLEFAGRPQEDVDDPWYTRNFSKAYDDILAGCQGLLEVIQNG